MNDPSDDVMVRMLSNLNDQDLVSYCRISKKASVFCNQQLFWYKKIGDILSLSTADQYRNGRSWSDYYIDDLRNINAGNAYQYLMDGARTGRLDHVIIALNMADLRPYYNEAYKIAVESGNTNVANYGPIKEAGGLEEIASVRPSQQKQLQDIFRDYTQNK